MLSLPHLCAQGRANSLKRGRVQLRSWGSGDENPEFKNGSFHAKFWPCQSTNMNWRKAVARCAAGNSPCADRSPPNRSQIARLARNRCARFFPPSIPPLNWSHCPWRMLKKRASPFLSGLTKGNTSGNDTGSNEGVFRINASLTALLFPTHIHKKHCADDIDLASSGA